MACNPQLNMHTDAIDGGGEEAWKNCVYIYIIYIGLSNWHYPIDIFCSPLSVYFTPVSHICRRFTTHTHLLFAYDNTIYTVNMYNMNNKHDINTYLDGSEAVWNETSLHQGHGNCCASASTMMLQA